MNSAQHIKYELPDPVQGIPGSLLLKELREKRGSYLKDQWFQSDFRLPVKLLDYILSVVDEMTAAVSPEMECIVKRKNAIRSQSRCRMCLFSYRWLYFVACKRL